MSFVYNSPIFSPKILNISEITPGNDTYSQMKTYIFELEQNLQNQQIEISKIKNQIINLEQEKFDLIQENEKKDIILKTLQSSNENLKSKNIQFQNKISELEKNNTSLNYNIIELIQKNKSLNSLNETIINSKNISSDLISVYNRLDEIEIIKNKLEFDNKQLINQIKELQKNYYNEINILNVIKNGEIQQLKKTIFNLNENLKQNPIKENYNNNNNSQIQSHIIIEKV